MTDGPRHRRAAPSRGERGEIASRARQEDDFGLDELRPPALRRLARALGMAGGGVAVVGALGIGLFPTQTFLEQRSDTAEAQERLDVLRTQNEAYERRLERLETDEEIERLAREQYSLAYPGEEAYAVLPAPLPRLELPELWPFGPMSGDPGGEPYLVADAGTAVP